MATSESPDLILMDLSLPEMDGWEATRRIKESVRSGSIPLIVLTAHALNTDREHAFETGCDDFDIKPVDIRRLNDKIQKLLNERSPVSEAS